MSSLVIAGARGALTAFAMQGCSLIARLIAVIILARLLIPEYFGLVAVVAALAEFSGNIIQFGLPLAAAQSPSLSERAKSSLFLINATLGFIFAGIFFLGAAYIARLYGDLRLVELSRWLAVVPLTVGISAQYRAQMMRDLRFAHIEVAATISRLLGMIAAVAVAAVSGSIVALILLTVLPQAIQLFWFSAVARWHPGRPGEWTETRQILAIGGHIFGINLMKNVSRTAIIPVLGVYENPRDVGYYDRAYQLSAGPANSLMDSFQRIAVPLLARVRSDSRRLQESFKKVQTTASLSLVTGCWIIAALGEPAVALAMGDEWRTAGVILQLLAIGTGFRIMSMIAQWLFIGGSASRAGLIFSFWSQPVVIAMSLGGLPWGVLGVAIGNTLAWGILWPISVVAAAKATKLKARSLLGDSVAIAAGFSVPAALVAALSRLLFTNPAVIVAAGLLASLVLVGLLTLLSPSLRSMVRSVVAAVLSRQERS